MDYYPQIHDENWLREQAKTKTAREIAEMVGCSQGAVMGAVKKFGVILPDPNRRGHSAPYILYPKLQDKKWLAEQIKLKTAKQIGKEMGASVSGVMCALRKFGIKIEKRTGEGTKSNYFRFPELQDKEWIAKAISKKSMRQVAKDVGCSYGGVVSAVRKFGLEVPQRSTITTVVDRSSISREAYRQAFPKGRLGTDSVNWKGGRRFATSGERSYIYVYAPEHPYATQGGYVMEHRLVVEQSIGRYLEPGELVHHRNGDPSDNNIDNLTVCDKKGHFQLHFDAVKENEAMRLEMKRMKEEIENLKKAIPQIASDPGSDPPTP